MNQSQGLSSVGCSVCQDAQSEHVSSNTIQGPSAYHWTPFAWRAEITDVLQGPSHVTQATCVKLLTHVSFLIKAAPDKPFPQDRTVDFRFLQPVALETCEHFPHISHNIRETLLRQAPRRPPREESASRHGFGSSRMSVIGSSQEGFRVQGLGFRGLGFRCVGFRRVVNNRNL